MSSSTHSRDRTTPRKPVVLMSMGTSVRKGHAYQVMTHKYITPLVELAGCVPLLVPTCCGVQDLAQYLDMADGVYLTGAGSNIDPALYGQDNLTPGKAQDPERDLFDMPLIHAAIARGLPIFGICRGMQEINVALGGDIYQKVYAEPGFHDHRENPEASVEEQYAPAHGVQIVADSWLHQVLGSERIEVNSLHGQGLKTLGGGLEAIAHADDGLVEAIHGPALSPFLLAVQWHPEWQASRNADSVKLFAAFGQACRERVARQSASANRAA